MYTSLNKWPWARQRWHIFISVCCVSGSVPVGMDVSSLPETVEAQRGDGGSWGGGDTGKWAQGTHPGAHRHAVHDPVVCMLPKGAALDGRSSHPALSPHIGSKRSLNLLSTSSAFDNGNALFCA